MMPYGASPGVSSPDGGGGKLIRVGALVAIVIARYELVWIFFEDGMEFRRRSTAFGQVNYRDGRARDE
jgi:hypothetical protein